MLLCRPFAVEGVEGQHFEPRWVFDYVPLHWIGSSSLSFLPNSGGLEGSDLLLKSLHPMTGVTISSLTLRLYFALVFSLDLRLDFVIRLMREWKRMELSESEISLSLLWLVEPACLDFFLLTHSSTRCISILSVSIV